MNMTKRNKSLLMTTAALVVVVILSLALSGGGCARHGFSYDTYQIEGGWGYDIKYKGQVKIHQPFIPAVSGSKPFPSRRLARKTAQKVIDQIIETGSPALSIETVNKIFEEK
jgi:hypothetical protein